MSGTDPIRLSKTMAFLLRHRPEVGNLTLDPDGWVEIASLCEAASRLLRAEVDAEQIVRLVDRARVQRFEVEDGRIRAVSDRRAKPKALPPDILYHATTADRVATYLEAGELCADDKRQVVLSADEPQAWRAAHRLGPAPQVLYVDTARARRHGAHFYRNRRNGLYVAERLPVRDVLNLQPNFAEQVSAGGIPVVRGPDGQPQMALIRVSRRSGVTWEVAKGKLDPGEPPEIAGVREVQEEMGIDVDFDVTHFVGIVRYGFLAPGGLPRLKTVYLYLLSPKGELPSTFRPAAAEGIGDVQWFSPREAARVVTHTSLRPVMRRAQEMVEAIYG